MLILSRRVGEDIVVRPSASSPIRVRLLAVRGGRDLVAVVGVDAAEGVVVRDGASPEARRRCRNGFAVYTVPIDEGLTIEVPDGVSITLAIRECRRGGGGRAKIGVTAPRTVAVHRAEIDAAIDWVA